MDQNDVNEIVESHLKNGQVVDRLVVPAHVGR
jgi:(2Fe-2S) ferredoxin